MRPLCRCKRKCQEKTALLRLGADFFLGIQPNRSDGLGAFPWAMESRKRFAQSADPLVDEPLVGSSPLLYFREAGLLANQGPSIPSVVRSEIQLVANDKKCASCKASYFLDQALVRVLGPGDIFNITRTHCGGVGVSAIRRGKLIFAVGAVASVPLGSDITVRTPDLLQKAEALLRSRDPEFEFAQHPVEVCIGNSLKIWYRGLVRMGGYHVWVEHGFIPCDPGTEASVSITLDEVCDWVAGSASTQLLALP